MSVTVKLKLVHGSEDEFEFEFEDDWLSCWNGIPRISGQDPWLVSKTKRVFKVYRWNPQPVSMSKSGRNPLHDSVAQNRPDSIRQCFS